MKLFQTIRPYTQGVRNIGWTVAIMVLCLCAVSTVQGQNLTGTINGVVRDDSGAVIPNAAVELSNADTGLVIRMVKTDKGGRYEAPGLLVGNYSVSVAMSGFKTTVVNQIKLNVDQAVPVDVVLHVGMVTAVVTVTADEVVPNLENAAADTLIEGKQVTELPLNQRNFLQFLALQPGVNAGTGTIPRGSTSVSGGNNNVSFSVNGQGHGANGFFFDGADFINHDEDTILGAYPSIDSLQQVNLLRDGYGAQYSGNGAAIVNLVSKAGTSQFHGTAYFFFRNQRLNANSYFNNLAGIAQAPFRYNDFGYSVGGPVLIPHVSQNKMRTYFFLSQEFLRQAQAVTASTSGIPTQAQRSGTFSTAVCTSYNSKGTCNPGSTSTTVANIDPTAAAYLKDVINKLPLPNNPNDPQGLISSLNGVLNENQTLVRIDHSFNDKLSVFFRFLNDPYDQVAPKGMGANTVSIPDIATTSGITGARNYLGHATYVPSPAWVIEGGVSTLHSYVDSTIIGLLAKDKATDFNPNLPYPNTSPRISTVSINGTAYKAPGPLDRINNILQGFVNVTHVAGRNTILFGSNVERFRSLYKTLSGTPGNFTFKAPASTGSAQAIFDQSFADFLIGYATSFSQSNLNGVDAINAALYEGYVQDNLKVTPRLIVNAGVRYTFFREATNQTLPLTNFDPATYNKASAPTIDTNGNICAVAPCVGGGAYNAAYSSINGLIIAGQNSPVGRKTVTQPHLNFAPRFGFAWNPLGDGKTAVRGGFGVYFLLPNVWENLVNQLGSNPPFIQSTSANNTSFGSPNGGIPSAASKTPAPPMIYSTEVNQKMAYIETFNLDVQRQLPGQMLLDVGYYGNAGRHITQTFDLNQPQAGAYVTSGIAAAGGLASGASTTKLNRIRPYQGYAAIAANLPIATSNYNSLQVQFKKRFRYGSEVGAAYTWSRGLAIEGAQDTSNIAADYGPSGDQRNHIFAGQGVYETPWYHNQRGLVGHLLGGYEVSGIVNYLSGAVHSPGTSGVDPAGLALLAGPAAARPDQVGDPNTGPKTRLQYFNTAAFALVPASEVRPGNASVNSIYGPNTVSVTLGLMHNTQIKDWGRLQLRAEAFNVFNHTNFSGIGTTLKNTNFGLITSAGDPRNMQLAAKFVF